ncbi:MAG TPA: hypothetical protein VGP72_06590 [Planctomycetota bacterium]|jgi:hypothetical protein
MAEKYNLEKMLKEIEEDKFEEPGVTNRKLSQEEIDHRLAETRSRAKSQPSK